MKTIITILTAVVLSQALSAQTTIIPDANFEQALIDLGYDMGAPDGSVPTANISSVTYLQVANKNISDLTGIEDFAALRVLNCQSNQLTNLDVSQNTELIMLNCTSNQLKCLNIKNTKYHLQEFTLNNNPDLSCIEVDDVVLATTTLWIYIDSTASFSTNCNNTCSSTTTGMAEHKIVGKTAEHGLSLDLYPNPVTSSLVVETEEPLKINLYNMQGQLILDQEITATYTLDTSGLPKGIYLLKATDEQGSVYSQKFIKE